MRNDLKFTTAQFLAQNLFFWLRNHFFKFHVGGVGHNLSQELLGSTSQPNGTGNGTHVAFIVICIN